MAEITEYYSDDSIDYGLKLICNTHFYWSNFPHDGGVNNDDQFVHETEIVFIDWRCWNHYKVGHSCLL